MTVTLHDPALRHARALVNDGKVVHDERDDWSEHAPSADDENRFLDSHSWAEYGHWYLGVDDEHPKDTKGHYKFPIGDFTRVHRCGVIAAESRAGQNDYDDIRHALKKLLKHIDA
ncbi:MAG: hypothetical protein ABWX65_04650 [Mycetocola sp.]